MRQQQFGVRLGQRMFLTALLVSFMTPCAWAQLTGSSGASSGGGLNATGGAGGTSTGGSSSGTGTIGTSTPLVAAGGIAALKNGSAGLAALANSTGATNSTTGNTIPVTSDPFNTFYVNPYSAGFTGGTTTTGFGQPVFAPTTTAPTTTATFQTYFASTATGFTSVGTRRTPAYTVTINPKLLVKHSPSKLTNELQQVLARSSFLKSKNNIRVEVLDGGIARLSGMVEDEDDKRLAEGLMRMTPGVQNVQNNLQISQLGLNQ